MSIKAKRVHADATVSDIELSDDPSDTELIRSMDGDGDLVTLGWIWNWEVLSTTGNSDDKLVIGQPPYIGSTTKQRTSCSLSSEHALKLVRHIEDSAFLRR